LCANAKALFSELERQSSLSLCGACEKGAPIYCGGKAWFGVKVTAPRGAGIHDGELKTGVHGAAIKGARSSRKSRRLNARRFDLQLQHTHMISCQEEARALFRHYAHIYEY